MSPTSTKHQTSVTDTNSAATPRTNFRAIWPSNWHDVTADIAGVVAQFFVASSAVIAAYSSEPSVLLPLSKHLIDCSLVFLGLGALLSFANMVNLIHAKNRTRTLPTIVAYAFTAIAMLSPLINENPLRGLFLALAAIVVCFGCVSLWFGAMRSA
jgi:hypothetical protein